MFSCVWLHFKKCFEKYFLVFGCVFENTIENKFSTCCSNFLTFSRLPNEYIISFIPQYRNTNKTQKKKIIKSDQIWTLRAIAIAIGVVLRAIAIDASRDCDRREGEIMIGAVLRAIAIDGSRGRDRRFVRSRLARRWDRDRRGASCDLADLGGRFGDLGGRSRRSKLWTISASSTFLVAWSVMSKGSLLFFLSLSLSLFLSLSLSFARDPKMVWR